MQTYICWQTFHLRQWERIFSNCSKIPIKFTLSQPEILKILKKGTHYSHKIAMTECSECDYQQHYREHVWVSVSNELHWRLLQSQYEATAARHPGWAKRLELPKSEFYKPMMRCEVDQFIKIDTPLRGIKRWDTLVLEPWNLLASSNDPGQIIMLRS